MKSKNLLKVGGIVVFLIFICAYYISNSKYYEYELNRKVIITNDKIKEFEQDVKNKKNVSLKQYSNTGLQDYTNRISNIVYRVSKEGNKVLRKGLKAIFRKINKLVEED